MRLCSRPNLPPQDLAAVFNAKFDRRTENKKAPSYKLLLKIKLLGKKIKRGGREEGKGKGMKGKRKGKKRSEREEGREKGKGK